MATARLAALAALALLASGCAWAPGPAYVGPAPVSAAAFATLPRATTFTTTRAAPLDPDPAAVTGGLVLHPVTDVVLFAGPGQGPVAVLPATELGAPTWVPVIETSPGWARVLLPSRPNHASGWVFLGYPASARVDIRRTEYLIRVRVAARRLTVTDGARTLGTWTVAVGEASTPTPTGRTFVLALLRPPPPSYSPIVLPLGFHSPTLTTFGGGPGTVGIHGWPDPSVFGQAVSHGCVRVPDSALRLLPAIPLGTLVLITP